MSASVQDARTLWLTAVSLEEAAIVLHKKTGTPRAFAYLPGLPVVFLFYRSIELALKAFLLVEGVPLQDLRHPRKFGHSIERLYAAAAKYRFKTDPPLTGSEENILNRIARNYADKHYEYPARLYVKMPTLSDLQVVCRKIVSAAEVSAFGDGRRRSETLLARHQ